MFGREKLYSIGFGTFAVSSLLCGLSQNVVQLVLFRMLQGMGAATTDDRQAFVASLNFTFMIALIIITVALGTSLMRGQKPEEAPIQEGSEQQSAWR